MSIEAKEVVAMEDKEMVNTEMVVDVVTTVEEAGLTMGITDQYSGHTLFDINLSKLLLTIR